MYYLLKGSNHLGINHAHCILYGIKVMYKFKKWLIVERNWGKLGLMDVCSITSMHIGIFDLEHVKVILGSFGALFPKFDCYSKTAHCRAKWIKIWASGMHVVCLCVPLTLNISRPWLSKWHAWNSHVYSELVCICMYGIKTIMYKLFLCTKTTC